MNTNIHSTAAKRFKQSGGFSIRLDGTDGHGFETGYFVSLKGFERRISDNQSSMGKADISKLESVIRKYIVDHSDILQELNAFVGGWLSGDELVLDVSMHIQSERAAMMLGKTQDQEAIWDCEGGVEIYC